MLSRRGVPCKAHGVRRNALGYHRIRGFSARKLICFWAKTLTELDEIKSHVY